MNRIRATPTRPPSRFNAYANVIVIVIAPSGSGMNGQASPGRAVLSPVAPR